MSFNKSCLQQLSNLFSRHLLQANYKQIKFAVVADQLDQIFIRCLHRTHAQHTSKYRKIARIKEEIQSTIKIQKMDLAFAFAFAFAFALPVHSCSRSPHKCRDPNSVRSYIDSQPLQSVFLHNQLTLDSSSIPFVFCK